MLSNVKDFEVEIKQTGKVKGGTFIQLVNESSGYIMTNKVPTLYFFNIQEGTIKMTKIQEFGRPNINKKLILNVLILSIALKRNQE